MRLLLDTHVAVWSVAAAGRLPGALVEVMRRNAAETYVSAASLWEIAIKHGLPRRDQMPFDANTAKRYFEEAGLQVMDVRSRHAIGVGDLPRLHADPFDRMLVAQAIAEGMMLLTMDRTVAGYGDAVMLF